MKHLDRGNQLAPGKLWSLWEMLKENATNFLAIGRRIRDAEVVFDLASADDNSPLEPGEIQELTLILTALLGLCSKVDLSTSATLVAGALKDLPQTSRELRLIVKAIQSELGNKLFLFVPSDRAPYFDKNDYLSEAARGAFPKANQELRDAGNCIASGLFTACVFHCMRALEYGIGALAKDVSVTYDVQNWQNVLDEIAKALADLGKSLPKGPAKSERLQFLSEAVAEFRHFKDGWRNHVSHNKVSYDESQARRAIDHVASFIQLLSAQLSE